MASPKRKKTSKFQNNITFVQYKMDKETQKKFNAWYTESGDALLSAVYETLQNENKLSLSWSEDHECFIASMTGKEDSLNSGRCLVMRSKEWYKALAACAYVHIVIFDGEIWDVSDETDLV